MHLDHTPSDHTPSEQRPPIPIGVGFLVALGVVHGGINVLIGLFILLDRDDAALQTETALSSTQLATLGVAALAAGVVHIALSFALRNGSQAVRLWFGMLALANVAVAFWGVVGTHAEQRVAASGSMVAGLFVLYLLFGSRRAVDFFDDASGRAYESAAFSSTTSTSV